MPRPRLLLVLIAASFLLVGLIEPFTARPADLHSPLSIMHMVAVAVLVYMWCRADAAARNAAPRNGISVLAAVLPPLGVPIYLFQSRHWKKALVSVSLAVAFLVLLVVLSVVGNVISEQLLGT
jgi:hypothetical protein